MQVSFRENPLIEPVANGGEPKCAADVERQVSEPMSESQQRLDGRNRAVPAGCGTLLEGIREALEISQGDSRSGFPAPERNRSDIGYGRRAGYAESARGARAQ